MNQFTEYCNRLIQEESDSVYHFCLKHHLERTGIRRMLSGERVPKDELFQEFLRALTLTPDEEKKLIELYQRQKIGEKRYENRIFVKEMLEYIGEIQMFSIENSDRKQETQIESVQKWGGRNSKLIEVSGRIQVRHSLEWILQREKQDFYSNIPITYEDFYPILYRDYLNREKEGKFFHLLTMLKKSDTHYDVNYNLRLMKSVLPFALQEKINYKPVYCYGNPYEMGSTGLYPYFLLSESALLLLSEDLERGFLYTDDRVVNAYRAEMQKLMGKTKPFIFKAESSEQAMNHYVRECVAASQPVYTLEYYPCILKAYTRELLEDCLRDAEDYMPFIEMVEGLAEFCKKLKPYDAFLSREGLLHFVETGEFGERYGEFLKPFSPYARGQILERLIQLCEEGRYRLHILPEGFLMPFPKASLELYENRRVVLLSLDDNSTFSYLEENTIYEAFEDYFKSLLEKETITTVEESIQILREIKKKLY